MQRREAKVEIGFRVIANWKYFTPFNTLQCSSARQVWESSPTIQYSFMSLSLSSAHSFPVRAYRFTSCSSGNCSYQSAPLPICVWGGKNAVSWFRLKHLWYNSFPSVLLQACVCWCRFVINERRFYADLTWNAIAIYVMCSLFVEQFFATLIWKVKKCKLNDLMHFRLHEWIMKSGKKWQSEHKELRIRFFKQLLGT